MYVCMYVCNPGDRAIAANKLQDQKFGWNCTFVDAGDEAALQTHTHTHTRTYMQAKRSKSSGGTALGDEAAVHTYIHTHIHTYTHPGKTIQKFGWNCTFVDVGDEAAVLPD